MAFRDHGESPGSVDFATPSFPLFLGFPVHKWLTATFRRSFADSGRSCMKSDRSCTMMCIYAPFIESCARHFGVQAGEETVPNVDATGTSLQVAMNRGALRVWSGAHGPVTKRELEEVWKLLDPANAGDENSAKQKRGPPGRSTAHLLFRRCLVA